MRILYLSDHGDRADYLRDCLFHGLRTLLGPDVVDADRLDVMYSDFPANHSIYGRGFSLYRLLPEIPVDRTDITGKIRTRYFDLVIYGSIHRCQSFLRLVADTYDGRSVCAIDGEDHPGYLQGLGMRYFKRELHHPQPGCHPISFAIPKEKIRPHPAPKTRIMAPCDPIDRTTYIYTTESAYYQQYAESYYGPTMRKAGFDCMRHYEILSQWCIPYFRVLEDLPAPICTTLPRPELNLAKTLIEYWAQDRSNDRIRALLPALWESLIDPVMAAVRSRMTTESLATYVLDTIGVRAKEYA